MTARQPKVHTQLGRVAVQIFAANDRMNQILIEHLDPRAQTLLCDGVAPHPLPTTHEGGLIASVLCERL